MALVAQSGERDHGSFKVLHAGQPICLEAAAVNQILGLVVPASCRHMKRQRPTEQKLEISLVAQSDLLAYSLSKLSRSGVPVSFGSKGLPQTWPRPTLC